MSDERDLATLPQRMRYAANVLEEAGPRCHVDPDTYWRATELRREAQHVADEDKETAEKEALVWELSRDMLTAFACGPDTGEMARKSTHIAAELLIQNGWTKP